MEKKKTELTYSEVKEMLNEAKEKATATHLERGDQEASVNAFALLEVVVNKIAEEEKIAYKLMREAEDKNASEREIRDIVYCFLIVMMLCQLYGGLYLLRNEVSDHLLEHLVAYSLFWGVVFFLTRVSLGNPEENKQTKFPSDELLAEVNMVVALLNSYTLGLEQEELVNSGEVTDRFKRRNDRYYQD